MEQHHHGRFGKRHMDLSKSQQRHQNRKGYGPENRHEAITLQKGCMEKTTTSVSRAVSHM